MNLLSGASFDRLQAAMNTSTLRQQVISNNIANAETPNFKRVEVSFETLLQQQMNGNSTLIGKRTDARHFYIGPNNSAAPSPEFMTDQSTMFNNNLNNVDIDREMSQLAANQLKYNGLIQQLNHEFKMKRTALGGN